MPTNRQIRRQKARGRELGLLQFLMITHYKTSMAFAASLYGITMQELSVSKSVSVRYVDVGENGEILRAA